MVLLVLQPSAVVLAAVGALPQELGGLAVLVEYAPPAPPDTRTDTAP